MSARRHVAARPRRGTVAVAVLLAVLLAGLLVAGMVRTGARDHDLSARRLETVQAFYAAEAGMNMAYRELMLGVDVDGDGAVGSISDDGDGGNDPAIGGGRAAVRVEVTGTVRTLIGVGRCGSARREITAVVE